MKSDSCALSAHVRVTDGRTLRLCDQWELQFFLRFKPTDVHRYTFSLRGKGVLSICTAIFQICHCLPYCKIRVFSRRMKESFTAGKQRESGVFSSGCSCSRVSLRLWALVKRKACDLQEHTGSCRETEVLSAGHVQAGRREPVLTPAFPPAVCHGAPLTAVVLLHKH